MAINIATNSSWKSEEAILRRVAALDRPGKHVAYQQLLMRYEDNVEEIREMAQAQRSAALKSIWLRRLGMAYRGKGEHEKAFAAFDEAVNTNPMNIDGLNSLGIVYLERGDASRGLSYLQRALTFDPAYADTHRILGVYYFREKDFTKAVEHLGSANFYDPDNKESSLYLALTYFLAGQKGKYTQLLENNIKRLHFDAQDYQFLIGELNKHGFENEAYRLHERLIEESRRNISR